MIISIDFDPIASFVLTHPWPTIALIFLVGIGLPAVWSARRGVAALAVLHVFLDATVRLAKALRGARR